MNGKGDMDGSSEEGAMEGMEGMEGRHRRAR